MWSIVRRKFYGEYCFTVPKKHLCLLDYRTKISYRFTPYKNGSLVKNTRFFSVEDRTITSDQIIMGKNILYRMLTIRMPKRNLIPEKRHKNCIVLSCKNRLKFEKNCLKNRSCPVVFTLYVLLKILRILQNFVVRKCSPNILWP